MWVGMELQELPSIAGIGGMQHGAAALEGSLAVSFLSLSFSFSFSSSLPPSLPLSHLMGLGFELRALCLQSWCSTT
jgi:hypothetical protein